MRSGKRATCATRLLSFPRDNKEWAQGDVNKRFDSVNIRFDQVNIRFDQVNIRFDQVNIRFDQVNCRIDDVLRINST